MVEKVTNAYAQMGSSAVAKANGAQPSVEKAISSSLFIELRNLGITL